MPKTLNSFAEAKSEAHSLANRDAIQYGIWTSQWAIDPVQYYVISEHDRGWKLLPLVYIANPDTLNVVLRLDKAKKLIALLKEKEDRSGFKS